MANGIGEPPEKSPSAILSAVEYPISRDEPRCRAEGCGFVGRCYPARRAAPAPAPAANVTP